MNLWNSYDDGWAVGWEVGRNVGYEEGFLESSQMFEQRISALWAEMHTLNARLAYLEKVITGEK